MDSEYIIHDVNLTDNTTLHKIKLLLENANLKEDIIDKCAVIYNEHDEIIATISKYLNTIKLLVVSDEYQGFKLANKLVTYMINEIYKAGYNEVFVFTKYKYIEIFTNLGFRVIYHNKKIAFFTNRSDLFEGYLQYLEKEKLPLSNTSVIIMNANPFTNGHLYLVQKACDNSDFVYIIPVKEDASLFTYNERKQMIFEGIKELKNAKLLEGSYYLVSKNVFPSYFLASNDEVIQEQTLLDTQIFVNYIAKKLDIKNRYLGDEPYSRTTNQYNEMIKAILPQYNINVKKVDRLTLDNQPISATHVRKYFINGDFAKIRNLVPLSTLNYLKKLDYKTYQKRKDLDKLVDKNH